MILSPHKQPIKIPAGREDKNWKGSKSDPKIHYLKYQEDGKDVLIIVGFVVSHGKEPGKINDATFQEKIRLLKKFEFKNNFIF